MLNMEIMSFGGGVQTVAMALMSCHGDLHMPDHVIFSDPKWELDETYEYLSWFIPYCEEKGMKFHVVDNGNIRDDALNPERRWASMPLFTLASDGKKGMIMRQCTNEYKVQPVMKMTRKFMGLKPYQRTKTPANIWLGISIDEATRMKPSRVKYCTNVYPFIENNISRQFCLTYIESKGLPRPPKSACVGCPFHSDSFWRTLQTHYKKEFEDACVFDEQVRHNPRKKLDNPMFLHRSCKPLREVDFTDNQMDFFEEECEGYCGL